MPPHWAMPSGVGGHGGRTFASAFRQTVGENFSTIAGVPAVAFGSSDCRQVTGGMSRKGTALQNESSRLHLPKKPLQHQPPRSFTVNVLRFPSDFRSGSALILLTVMSCKRSRFLRLSNAGSSASETNTAKVSAFRFVRPLKEGRCCIRRCIPRWMNVRDGMSSNMSSGSFNSECVKVPST
ncbi:unnamed protein product [Phytophthora lilii]|uniref:Unnamed protein product n=1 Tax=Phytophthora lilii TaxID=2077276 RepID=A0A9W7CNX5_9STRA|nr:unnamed protein product [Phytophthora lilii]